MSLPYKQKRINKSTVIRRFSKNTNDSELVWHRDRDNRLVEVIKGKGWYIQLDNKVPQKLFEGSRIIINAGEFHRLINGKWGNNNLILRIIESNNNIY